MSIEDKIKKLKKLGGLVTIKDYTNSIESPGYNEVFLYYTLSDEEIHEILDEKISLLTRRPWLISESTNPYLNLCESCAYYRFQLRPKSHDISGDIFTYETCINPTYSRFNNILKHRHSPIKYCVDYKKLNN